MVLENSNFLLSENNCDVGDMRLMTSSEDEIKKQVEQAFADVPYPGDENLVPDPNSHDMAEVHRDFRGKHWKDLSIATVCYHHDDLALFTHEGCRFYLPAFIRVALDRLDPLQSTLGLLLPEPELCCVPLRRIGIGAVLEMVGNDSLLEQLFHNLCLNAIEP